MEIVLKDRDGNDILSPTLTQWDQGVTIQIRDFFYSTSEWQYAYLHFYNSTKREIYAQIPTRDDTTLTTEIPNQLLREPYPITVHVYVASGDVATNPDASVEARTVFTAAIGVEARMCPEDFEEVDNAGHVSAAQIQQNLHDQIEVWEAEKDMLFGTTPLPEAVTCYYNAQNGKMYTSKSGDAYTNEIAGESGKFYKDDDTGVLYFYENAQWVEWSVSGTLVYAKARADACDNTATQLQSDYATAINAKEIALNNTFDAALDGCVIRMSTTIPTAASYGNETKPVITFVIGA